MTAGQLVFAEYTAIYPGPFGRDAKVERGFTAELVRTERVSPTVFRWHVRNVHDGVTYVIPSQLGSIDPIEPAAVATAAAA